MGYFAILHPKSNERRFRVDRCHTNLFVLSRLGLYEFFWDIGILLRAEADAPHAADFDVEIVLPFATSDTGCEDLSSKVLDQAIATQIFGEKVLVDETNVRIPSYGDPFRVVAVPKESAVRVDDSGDTRMSIWRISVPSRPEKQCYLRLRFKISHPDVFWQWQPIALARRRNSGHARIRRSRCVK